MENLIMSPFAERVGPIKEDHLEGYMLNICGNEYKAWNYDTYIYDAIEIASKWVPEEVTFERILHVRYWIRENVQHGHDHDLSSISSIKETKLAIDALIKAEHKQFDGSDSNKEFRKDDLKYNADIFKK